ncbi:MAG: filamentous hemagglutinin N-terminal domain-containing protein, partial [Selenomonas sp.]|nr:filamentous hemagglutinin N-terminal domain-containing protein [Selenomonas sp.]
ASSILGQLTGGGSVYLINPNGILFGANAKVDVGAFYASTRNIDAVNTVAFAASGTNPLLTTVSDVGGDIINRGNIAANQIVLEGDHISIQNYENIQNSAGEVLNSDAVTLKATESGNIHVGYNITKYRADNNINIDYDYDRNYAATSTTKKDGVTANGMYYWGTSQENNHPTFNYAATTLDGTAITATPYALIHNIYEWENLNQVSWGPSNFMLANDIDGTNYTYTPITSFDARTPHLDGLGYTIKNLSYEAVSGGSPAGLFITLKDATMENLNIASSTSFKAYQEDASAGWRHAGSLAYETIGNVLLRNVHSSANVTNGRTIGGLVAFNRGGGLTIMDSSFDGTVTGSSDVGGLVGSHAGSSIYETGKLTIKNSYNTGSISYDTTNASTSDALHMGGLVGTSAGGLSIVNSYNTGTIDSSAAENITGSVTYVGGLAGYVNQTRGKDNYTIEKSYNTGDVIAYNPNSESYAFAGGLFGYYQNDSDTALAISEVYNAGNVKAQAAAVNGTKGNRAIGAYAGGLIGYSKGSDGSGEEAFTIENAYAAKLAGGATAAVTISGGTKGSGGIIGFVDGADGKTSINSSYWYSSVGMGAYGDRITTDGNDSLAGSQYIMVNTTSGNLDYASALAAYKADSGSNPNPNARDTYTALGWDIGNNGGESTVWRIFNLHTPPMLRTFLKPKSVAANVTVTKEYNGTAQSVNYSDLNALGIYGDTTGSLGNTTFGSQTNAGTAVIGYNDNSPNSLSALTWSGQDGVDYDDINFTITPKNVSVSFANPTKEYDGTKTASIANPTLTGLISSDSGSVSVSAASAAYDSKNAGTGKIVTYTGLT